MWLASQRAISPTYRQEGFLGFSLNIRKRFQTMKRRLAFLSWGAAVLFGAAALFLPPQGEIDHTVLLLCAQFLLFAATLLGVDGYYDKMQDLIKK